MGILELFSRFGFVLICVSGPLLDDVAVTVLDRDLHGPIALIPGVDADPGRRVVARPARALASLQLPFQGANALA